MRTSKEERFDWLIRIVGNSRMMNVLRFTANSSSRSSILKPHSRLRKKNLYVIFVVLFITCVVMIDEQKPKIHPLTNQPHTQHKNYMNLCGNAYTFFLFHSIRQEKKLFKIVILKTQQITHSTAFKFKQTEMFREKKKLEKTIIKTRRREKTHIVSI